MFAISKHSYRPQVVQAPEALRSVRNLLSWRLVGTGKQQLFRLVRARHPLLLTMRDWCVAVPPGRCRHAIVLSHVYYAFSVLERNGHNFRPIVVLLMAKAVSTAAGEYREAWGTRTCDLW